MKQLIAFFQPSPNKPKKLIRKKRKLPIQIINIDIPISPVLSPSFEPFVNCFNPPSLNTQMSDNELFLLQFHSKNNC